MSRATPRMRMFAGPNGSGKSTIKGVIEPELLGVYINPDEIEKEIANFGFLDLSWYGVVTTADEVLPFFQQWRKPVCLMKPLNCVSTMTN
jgi:predicted kinase